MSGRNIRPLIFRPFRAFLRVGQNVGQAVAPHFDPRLKVRFCNKKAPKAEVFDAFWSCWADSNRRPHPYQKPLLIVDKYPFMLGYFPESLVVQGVRGFPFSSCVIRVCLVLGRFIPSAGRFVGSCLGFIALDNSQTHSHRWNLRLPLRCDRCT